MLYAFLTFPVCSVCLAHPSFDHPKWCCGRFSQQCCWWSRPYRMCHCITGWVVPGALKDHSFVCRVMQLDPEGWRHDPWNTKNCLASHTVRHPRRLTSTEVANFIVMYRSSSSNWRIGAISLFGCLEVLKLILPSTSGSSHISLCFEIMLMLV